MERFKEILLEIFSHLMGVTIFFLHIYGSYIAFQDGIIYGMVTIVGFPLGVLNAIYGFNFLSLII